MKVLVVKLADIGDLLTTVPALKALRAGLPAAEITLLAPPHSAPVLEGSPWVDRIITFEKHRFDSPRALLSPRSWAELGRLAWRLRREGFDWVVIMHHLVTNWGVIKFALLSLAAAPRRLGLDDGRGWFLTHRIPDPGYGGVHEVECWLRLVGVLGVSPADRRIEVPISELDRAWARQALSGLAGHVPVAVAPGTGTFSPARRWPADRFAELATRLADRFGAGVVLVGGPDNEPEAGVFRAHYRGPLVDLVGRTTIRQAAAVLAGCKLFLGNDGGLMHLAAAVGTPVVAVFGPSNHRAWGPWRPDRPELARVVRTWLTLPCQPCLYVGNQLGRRWGCDSLACLETIRVEDVLSVVESINILGRPAPAPPAGP